eukprot:jgi/Chrpa1/4156/Chrysochromulina_OHIO_Genome00014500-RA
MTNLNPNMQTRSMFGVQVLSKRRSGQRYGFGSSTRAVANKVFLSSEHAKLAPPNTITPSPNAYTLRAAVGPQSDGKKPSAPLWGFGSADRFQGNTKPSAQNPGPGAYDARSGLGVQVSSTKEQQPLYGFGTSTRDHVAKVFVSEEHNKSLYGIDSPGPVYTMDAAIGRQQLSQKSNGPAWVQGVAERWQYDHVKRAATSPGPGSYTLKPAISVQVSSTMISAPMPGFGTSNREHMQKLFISTEHEKGLLGNNSPGPCSYKVPEGNGPQHLSVWHTQPSWGFGTSARWQQSKNSGFSVPGPAEPAAPAPVAPDWDNVGAISSL